MEKLRLYYPVNPFRINQHFGDNSPCVKDFGLSTQHIVMGTDNVTCPVGYEKLYPKFGMSGHNGIDLAAGEQPFYFPVDGVIIEKQFVPARGLGLSVLTNQQYDFGQYGIHYARVRHWHLKEMYVEVGDKVSVGTKGGLTDNTGYSSGNHLHWELNLFDRDLGGHPVQFIAPGMIAGAIDPVPYIVDLFADDYTIQVSYYQKLVLALQALVKELKK